MRYMRQIEVDAIFCKEDGSNLTEVIEWARSHGFDIPLDRDDIPRGFWHVNAPGGLVECWLPDDFKKEFTPLHRVITCRQHLTILRTKQQKIDHVACKRRPIWYAA